MNLTCFAVDVHHSSWSHCHKCCYGSSEHTRGASCRPGSTWRTTSTRCCCKEKMIVFSMFFRCQVLSFVQLYSYSFLDFWYCVNNSMTAWSLVQLLHDDVVFCLCDETLLNPFPKGIDVDLNTIEQPFVVCHWKSYTEP
jgi:hypothetical protein